MPPPGYTRWFDQHVAARAVVASRYTRSDTPRIRIRLRDPIARRSVGIFAAGLLLIAASRILDPDATGSNWKP